MSDISGETKQEKTFTQELIDFIKDLAIIIVVVFIIRSFIILPFQISGQSMYESYYDREFIIVDKMTYLLFKKPQRGDVVVFNTHIEGKEYYIKRIIGIPGDEIKIEGGKVFVKALGENDFKELDEKYLSPDNYQATYVKGSGEMQLYTVPEESYFVMGDNRNASTDSRSCFKSSCSLEGATNFVEKKDITGRLLLDLGYFNFKSFAFINPNLGIETKPRWFSSPSKFTYE